MGVMRRGQQEIKVHMVEMDLEGTPGPTEPEVGHGLLVPGCGDGGPREEFDDRAAVQQGGLAQLVRTGGPAMLVQDGREKSLTGDCRSTRRVRGGGCTRLVQATLGGNTKLSAGTK